MSPTATAPATSHDGQVSVFGEGIAYFNEAAAKLELNENMKRVLTHPSRQVIISIPFARDNGSFEVFTGFRVQYNFARGPAKGGVRFHPGVTLDEVTASFPELVGPLSGFAGEVILDGEIVAWRAGGGVGVVAVEEGHRRDERAGPRAPAAERREVSRPRP